MVYNVNKYTYRAAYTGEKSMKKIGLIPNAGKDAGLANTRRIAEYLDGRAELLLEEKYKTSVINAEYGSLAALLDGSDCLIVLGGDGTMLQNAAECARRSLPVLGINLGRVGFLTEVELDNIEGALDKLLSGDFGVEKRMLMRVELIRGGRSIVCTHALNDIVTSKNAGAKLIAIELYTNGELVNRYTADGLIIATPTGSTGYSISAGGPVIDPQMELYVATPICAHMLSVRSAVLPPDKELVVKLDEAYPDNGAVVSADGDVIGSIRPGDEVRITRSNYRFSMIKTGSYSFYDTVLKKLS